MKYKVECLQLAALCENANVPYEIRQCWDGWQLCYPCADPDIRVSDAVCHSGSYGHERGLLEIMGLVNEEEVGDEVEGWLTAVQVFERWHKHWLEIHAEEEGA
jgi:hypothetical protein